MNQKNNENKSNVPEIDRSEGNRNQKSNHSMGSIEEHPKIPEERGEPDCPVCLTRIQNRSYLNACLHEFCFPCIQEWSRNHNHCPVCRLLFTKILHNIRSESDYDEEEVEEPLNASNGAVIMSPINPGEGILLTPLDSGIYVLNLRPLRRRRDYSMEYFGPHQIVLLENITENTLVARAERLEVVLAALDILGYHRPEPHGRHPPFLQYHRHNNQNY